MPQNSSAVHIQFDDLWSCETINKSQWTLPSSQKVLSCSYVVSPHSYLKPQANSSAFYLCFCLFWKFYINGITWMKYVVFCVWRIVVLTCTFLMANDFDYLFIYLACSYVFSVEVSFHIICLFVNWVIELIFKITRKTLYHETPVEIKFEEEGE